MRDQGDPADRQVPRLMRGADTGRTLGPARQAVRRVVEDLVAQGHVLKLANPDHARSELISLTPDGRSLLERLRLESDRHRSQALETANVTQEDLAAVQQVLRRLVAAFGR